MDQMACIDTSSDGRIRLVNQSKIISVFLIVVVGTFVLFDVEFVFDITGSSQSQIEDPDVEVAYENCYAYKDDEIHATAFGTIDNPDVQKEFITSNRARAAAECRNLHPAVMITVEEPGRFNLVDLTPRFW